MGDQIREAASFLISPLLHHRCRGYQKCNCLHAMGRHTLIVEAPDGGMVTMGIFVDDPGQILEIGRELFPGRR